MHSSAGMRLTVQLLQDAPQYTNPLQEREIDLRGRNLQLIDSAALSELHDDFDSIDVSENEIARLDNFPTMERLTTIIAHQNHITRIARTLGTYLPNLHSLIMHNNNIRELEDLKPLAGFPSLERVSLIGNPVVNKQWYRLYVIAHCKKLKLLDFGRVLDKERAQAKELFPDAEAALGEDKAAARRRRREERKKGIAPSSGSAATGSGLNGMPTEEEDKKLEAELAERLANAEGDEMDAIEAELNELLERRKKRRRLEQ